MYYIFILLDIHLFIFHYSFFSFSLNISFRKIPSTPSLKTVGIAYYITACVESFYCCYYCY